MCPAVASVPMCASPVPPNESSWLRAAAWLRRPPCRGDRVADIGASLITCSWATALRERLCRTVQWQPSQASMAEHMFSFTLINGATWR